MAYTLQELLVIGAPPPGSEDTVDVTLMITQEDGRSGWGRPPSCWILPPGRLDLVACPWIFHSATATDSEAMPTRSIWS